MPKKSFLATIRSLLPRLGRKAPAMKHILGIDAMNDFRLKVPFYEIKTIFDVGANKGQSAIAFRKQWPNAHIHCFEPFQYAFQLLCHNTEGFDIHCHKIALGAFNGHLDVQISDEDSNSARNSVLSENNVHDPAHLKAERVALTTVSDFCKQNEITFIDLLKIDTEGYDLEVLKGALKLLESSSIFCIQVEVGMNPMNTFHVGFHTMCDYLSNYGYLLFGIYNQAHEWKPRRPVLRRCDALFIADQHSTVEKLRAYKEQHDQRSDS